MKVFFHKYHKIIFTFNEGLENIGSYAFYVNASIDKITIPSTVKSIGESGFGWNVNTIEVLGKSSLEDFEEITDYSLIANEIIFENATQN